MIYEMWRVLSITVCNDTRNCDTSCFRFSGVWQNEWIFTWPCPSYIDCWSMITWWSHSYFLDRETESLTWEDIWIYVSCQHGIGNKGTIDILIIISSFMMIVHFFLCVLKQHLYVFGGNDVLLDANLCRYISWDVLTCTSGSCWLLCASHNM